MVLRLKCLYVFAASLLFATQIFAQAPRPRFNKQNIQFTHGSVQKKLSLDLAENPQQHAYGLMNRTEMGTDDGMIFIFQTEKTLEFWMKDTLIDLDIAYISKDKKIVDIQTMKATTIMQTNYPSYPSKKPAQYAVEMNAGWFKKNKIGVGGQLKILTRPMSKK